jgi:iron complex outermembrane receptor protein
MKKKTPIAALGAWLALALVSAPPVPGADVASPIGVIEGRVFSAASNNYLERVRVTVENTGQETLTDADGVFRLTAVPVGTARVKFFYTGFAPQTESITVTAAQTTQFNVTLGATAPPNARGEVVQLDAFTVATSKEMSGAAIAINEQRFAPNLRNVVATDELGFVPEGNVAEFIKFMPGVSVDNVGGFARGVSLNGVSPDYVPVTIDGFSVASANPGGGTARNVSLDMLSINNLARVEVVFSPTPESPGSALAGSVNMVPRSSFERAKPVVDWNLYLLMRDNARHFHKTPGPQRAYTRKVHPGFDFTYLKPVNKNFGFTISAGTSTNYLNQDFIQNTWRGASAETNGTTFPHTTPDRPYLSSTAVRDNTKDSTRNSFSTTLDARLGPSDRLTFSFQFSSTAFANMSRTLTFNVGATDVGGFTPFSTRGRTGSGTLVLANVGQTRDNRTVMPTLTWRHTGPLWQGEVGLGYSRATHTLRNMDRGLFNNVNAQRTGVTVSFADIFYLRPNTITVTEGAAATPVDPYRLSNYALLSTTGSEQHNSDTQRTAFARVRRAFDWRVPVTLRTGLDVRRSERDLQGFTSSYSYVGRDGRPSTTLAGGDDAALPFLDDGASQRVAPFGFPRIEWVSNEAVLDSYRANPTHFVPNANSEYRSIVTASKFAAETVSSVYFRGDVELLQRRLKLIGGVRAEQTNVSADGPLNDPTRNFQRDASGRIVTVASPTPADPNRRVPALIHPTTDALAVSRLTFLERGAHTEKEYLRFFPSLNASYNVRENLVARAAVYQSVGRPNLNQYAGGITLPDTENPASTSNRIVVNNAGIKAWTARTANARIEYYFRGVGQISVGGFLRNYENFFEAVTFRAPPDFFELYGIDPSVYGGYDVATQRNIPGTVKTSGVDFSYKQALTRLPHWARGVQVFANASAQRVTGEAAENFAGYVPRVYSWGVSLTRQKFNVRANWNYRGRQRDGTGLASDPQSYAWLGKKLNLDLQGEYFIRRGLALFANLRNVNDATEDVEITGPATPAHAQFRSRQDFGSLWTVGLKGSF